MLIGQTIAKRHSVRPVDIQDRFLDPAHQVGHHLIVTQHAEGDIERARNTARHFVGLPILDPEDAAENRLGKSPTVRHKRLAKYGERLRQGIAALERLRKPITADVLDAQLAGHHVPLNPLEGREVRDVGQRANARPGQEPANGPKVSESVQPTKVCSNRSMLAQVSN